jgi:hypothetical protein
MPSHREDLSRLIAGDYLDGVEKRPVEEIRAMRAECQEAEVALSYLRRLVQGRLDIVHIYLDPPAGDATPELSTIVSELPGILAGPGRPPGPGHLPMLLSPDTEESDLTSQLDEILDAEGIGNLAQLDRVELGEFSKRLETLERNVSYDRRALHVVIDRLQAEIVERYKTGRASVDGLLS